MRTLIKVDRNGTKYWDESTCPKCGGEGKIYYYSHVEGGICFKCGGSGVYHHKIVERTPEYEEKLRLRRLAKARKTAPERNAKYFESLGCSSEGKAWLVLGNSYDIKEELKAAGATYNWAMGWHFNSQNEEFNVVEFDVASLGHEYEDGTIHVIMDELEEAIKKFKRDNAPKVESKSIYIGEVKDKVSFNVSSFRRLASWDTQFGTTYLYEFVTEEENVIIWKTGKWIDEDTKISTISGTVKAHKEFRGVKQTELTRCKVA